MGKEYSEKPGICIGPDEDDLVTVYGDSIFNEEMAETGAVIVICFTGIFIILMAAVIIFLL